MIRQNSKIKKKAILTNSTNKPKKKIPIWLVDDNKDFCFIFNEALKESEEIVCTHCFNHGDEVINAFLTTLDLPAVILLDINMPGKSGIETLQALKKLSPDIRIIMLTVNDREENIHRALQLGASGYLLKTSSIREILSAIRVATKGGVPMDPFIIQKMLTMFTLNPEFIKANKLTRVEKEIVQHTSNGLKTVQIAKKMGLSAHTIRTHFKKIFRKLDVHTRAELTAKSIKENLI